MEVRHLCVILMALDNCVILSEGHSPKSKDPVKFPFAYYPGY